MKMYQSALDEILFSGVHIFARNKECESHPGIGWAIIMMMPHTFPFHLPFRPIKPPTGDERGMVRKYLPLELHLKKIFLLTDT